VQPDALSPYFEIHLRSSILQGLSELHCQGLPVPLADRCTVVETATILAGVRALHTLDSRQSVALLVAGQVGPLAALPAHVTSILAGVARVIVADPSCGAAQPGW
jgi:hypothetical protein